MTIKFCHPPQMPGQPNLSMFCAKTEILLELSGLEYEHQIVGDPSQGPKQKVPFIEDAGEIIGDSTFIEEHLKQKHGINFYDGISAETEAQARLITTAIEEQLYWVTVHSRWAVDENWPIMEELFFGQMPEPMRAEISTTARQHTIKALWGHGIGRHSVDEVVFLGKRLVDSLSIVLADQPYFAGEKITTVDASAYGALINILQNPVPSPMLAHLLTKPNLCAFVDRISDRFFPNAVRAHEAQQSAA